MKKHYRIIVLGSQGSGKGTQSQLLAKKLKISAVSMGDLLRAEKRKGGKIGKLLSSFMDKGLLVPYKITLQLIKKFLKKNENGIIIDGFPRDMDQVYAFEKFFHPTHILFIKLSTHETIRRLSGRRSCPKCNAIYHLVFKPPKKKDYCDECGAKLLQRDDDRARAIKKRLQIFSKNTMPVIKYYKKKYGIIKINGEKSIEGINTEILEKIKK